MRAVFLILVFLATACYRMPEEGFHSRVPLTNNPNVVPQKSSIVPGMPY